MILDKLLEKLRKKDSEIVLQDAEGIARVDKRTKNLTKRLKAGEIAVIDHTDIDRVSAEALVECRPAAVLNAAPSTSGRYPNLGPSILLAAGIPLIDNLGEEIMGIPEGTIISFAPGGKIYRDGELIATGVEQNEELNAADLARARAGMKDQFKAFAANTMEYMEKEQDLILGGVGVPEIATSLVDKHVLIVVRGYRYKEDLIALAHYIREYRPVIMGVDGGADAVLEAGYTPDIIIGDMDSVSDSALRCGAEIIVHAYRNGKAPGQQRVQELGLDYVVFPAAGTSEDIAMLLADAKGAELIVAVGTHSTLIEYLDKGRAGMASTFLTRLQVGAKLIDAKGVSQLYHYRISNLQIFILVLAGFLAIGAAVIVTPMGQILLDLIRVWISDIFHWLQGIF